MTLSIRRFCILAFLVLIVAFKPAMNFLLTASLRGSWSYKHKVVETTLSLGADANSEIGELSLLHYAVLTNDHVTLRLLLSNGANVDIRDKDQNTPLITMVNRFPEPYPLADIELFRFLIDKKADVNAQGRDGRTALHYAVQPWVSAEIVKLLLASGANVYAKDDVNQTPYDVAINSQNMEAIVLIEKCIASMPFRVGNSGATKH